MEADHGLIDGHVATRTEECPKEALTLVVEGVSLLDDGLPLTARGRGCDVEVAVGLTEAIPGHEAGRVVVMVARLPVVMEFREDDDALADTDSQVPPQLLCGDRDPDNCLTRGGVQIRVGDDGADEILVDEALKIVELCKEAPTGQCDRGISCADGRVDVVELLGP